MSFKRTPQLLAFLSRLSDTDQDSDSQTATAYAEQVGSDSARVISEQLKKLIASGEIPVDELGSEANRWFADAEEAGAWLTQLLAAFDAVASGGAGGDSDVVVKDSNGAVLIEGDSVTVIKDLKVKGGSSDLKRGTLIKKIHLIGDPDNIECRVDGSTLVLKTMYLKKA